MTPCSQHSQAGKQLYESITEGRTGFVARVAIPAGMASFSDEVAHARRTCAKLAMQRGDRSYMKALAEPSTDYERGRICSDRRAVLAEMLVSDVLASAQIDHHMQALVSHVAEKGADVTLAGKKLDIKSAGQGSSRYNPGFVKRRFRDDKCMMVNDHAHKHYCKDPQHSGYLCVFIYISDDIPYQADLFHFTVEQVNSAQVYQGCLIGNNGEHDYRRITLPFPDEWNSLNAQMRENWLSDLYTSQTD